MDVVIPLQHPDQFPKMIFPTSTERPQASTGTAIAALYTTSELVHEFTTHRGMQRLDADPRVCRMATMPTSERDSVDHPSHYTQGGIETIDAIEAMVSQPGWSPATGLRLGNVLKYLWRHAAKGGVESLKKARWYLDREIKMQEKAAEKKP